MKCCRCQDEKFWRYPNKMRSLCKPVVSCRQQSYRWELIKVLDLEQSSHCGQKHCIENCFICFTIHTSLLIQIFQKYFVLRGTSPSTNNTVFQISGNYLTVFPKNINQWLMLILLANFSRYRISLAYNIELYSSQQISFFSLQSFWSCNTSKLEYTIPIGPVSAHCLSNLTTKSKHILSHC